MKKMQIFTRDNYDGATPYPLPVSIRSSGSKIFSCGEKNESTEFHSPFFELIWCKQNVGDVILYGDKFTLAANDVFCYFPHERHRFHALSENWEIYWLSFDGPLAAAFWESYNYPRKMHVHTPFPQELFERIAQDVGSTSPKTFRNTLSLLCQLFALLGEEVPDTKGSLVQQALTLIRENLQQPDLNVNFLAEQLNVHRSTLVAEFRKELNRSPKDAIRDRRISKAKRLLSHTALPVREIATRCGFPCESSFCRFFLRNQQKTPLQYRQQFTGKDFLDGQQQLFKQIKIR